MQRRFEEAVASLQTALRLDPGLPLGRQEARPGPRRARAAAPRPMPHSKDGSNRIAGSRQRRDRARPPARGRKDEAIATLKAHLRLHPGQCRCAASARTGLLGRRPAHVRHRSAAAPRDDARAGPCRGLEPARRPVASTRERAEEAISCFRSATSIEPENARAWSGLGARLRAGRRNGEKRQRVCAVGRSSSRTCLAYA